MADKLGFTFYPKDWWTSDTFFELNVIQRYIYLECLFTMYSNNGLMKSSKSIFENRQRIIISDTDWQIVTSKFIEKDGHYTDLRVNKRLRSAIASRENGKNGGRPPKIKKPEKPTEETCQESQNNLPLKENRKEKEIKREYEGEIKHDSHVDRSQKTTHDIFLEMLESDPKVKEDLSISAGTLNWNVLKAFAISKANEYRLGGEFEKYNVGLLLKFISQDWKDPTKNKLKSETHKPNQRPTGKKETR